MIGAIIGDIGGTPWTGRSCRSEPFTLLPAGQSITGESLHLIAMAEALLEAAPMAATLRLWSERYPDMILGGQARAAAAGWLAKSLDEAQLLGRATAKAANERYEGLRGAEALAGTLWLARQGLTSNTLREEAETRYHYMLGLTLDERAEAPVFAGLAQDTMAIAMDCALQATSFEDAIQRVVYIGGDTTGAAAVAGAIAEARFGIPQELVRNALSRVPAELQTIIGAVYARAGIAMGRPSPRLPDPVDEIAIVERPVHTGWLSRLKTRVSKQT